MKTFARFVVVVVAGVGIALVAGCGDPKGASSAEMKRPNTAGSVTPVHVETVKPIEAKTDSRTNSKSDKKSAKPYDDAGMFQDFNSVSGPAAREIQNHAVDEPEQTHATDVINKELNVKGNTDGLLRDSEIRNGEVIVRKAK